MVLACGMGGGGGLHFLTILGAFSKLVSGVSGRQHQGKAALWRPGRGEGRGHPVTWLQARDKKAGRPLVSAPAAGREEEGGRALPVGPKQGLPECFKCCHRRNPRQASVLPSVWKR